MDRQQRIDHYIKRLSEKGFEIYDVRRDLESQNVEEEEIKVIVRAVDEELQKRLLAGATKDQAASFIRFGVILALIGALLLVLSATRIIYIGEYIFIGYGPFFIGLGMLFVGLLKKQRSKAVTVEDPQAPDANQKISFRKNRK